jgi:GWxTD domain-containing protein
MHRFDGGTIVKRTAALALTIAAFASGAFADGLSKPFKKWDRSPEAYFLTNAERAEWKKVKTDQEAQNFILDYKSKRGPEFEKLLKERIAAADKYFSAGEIKGSETLRGKVIIVFGPPSAVDQAKANVKSPEGGDANASFAAQSGRGEAVSLGSGGKGPLNYASPHAQSPTFTLAYDEQAAPKAIGKPFKVELKMISNADQESWDPKDLDAKFEAVAEASIHPADAAPKPAEATSPH